MKFFTRLMVYISLICLIAELSYTSTIFVDYLVNQNYYSKTLCINKDKPELACNGQCVLMQKLALSVQQNSDKKNRQIVEILELFQNLFFEECTLDVPRLKEVVAFELEKIPTHLLENTTGYSSLLLDPPRYFN